MQENSERKSFTDPIPLKLTDEQRMNLVTFMAHPGYQIFMEMMDVMCVTQDAKLTSIPNWDHAKVISEHGIAQAYWEFQGRLRNQLEYEVKELKSAKDEKKLQPDAEQEFVNETLNPLRKPV